MVLDSQDGLQIYHAEQQVMGLDHSGVDGELARQWNFPPLLQECIAYHHAAVSAGLYPREVAVVHLANVFPRMVVYFPVTGRAKVKRLRSLHNNVIATECLCGEPATQAGCWRNRTVLAYTCARSAKPLTRGSNRASPKAGSAACRRSGCALASKFRRPLSFA